MKKWKRILVVLLVALMLLASGSMAEEQVVVFDEGLPEIDFVGQGGEQADALDDVDLSELELADSEDYKTYSLQENDSFGAGEPFYDLYIGVKEKYAVKTNGLGEKLTFQSSDTSIVKVSKKGVLTGVNEGKAILTIFSNKKEVRKHEINVLPVPNKVRLDQKSITIGVKETITVEPIIPEGTHASFTWSSKKKKIATVNQNGKIKGMKVGKTTITVKTHNGKKATITVNVLKAPDKLSLDKTNEEVKLYDTIKLIASIPKGSASNITWSSSNWRVADVKSDGTVETKHPGTAKITAKTYNGKKAVCKISVKGNYLPDFARETFEDPECSRTEDGKIQKVATWNDYVGGSLSCTYYTLRKLRERGLGFPFKTDSGADGGQWYDNCASSYRRKGDRCLYILMDSYGYDDTLENVVVSFGNNGAGHVVLIDYIYRDSQTGELMVKYSDQFGAFGFPVIHSEDGTNEALVFNADAFIDNYRGYGLKCNGAILIGT